MTGSVRSIAAASASGRWLPIKSRVPSVELEPDAAIAAGDQCSLAVASGANAPEAVVGDRPVASRPRSSGSCRSARCADRSGPSRTRRGRPLGVTSVVMCSRKTTRNIRSAKPMTRPSAISQRPAAPWTKHQAGESFHQRDQGVDPPIEVLLFAVDDRRGLEGRHRRHAQGPPRLREGPDSHGASTRTQRLTAQVGHAIGTTCQSCGLSTSSET